MQTEEVSSDRSVSSSAGPAGRKGARLADLLVNSKWSYGKDPFPHILVEQVFIDSAYSQILAAFRETCSRSDSGQPQASRLVFHKGNFDAYLMPFRPSMSGPLSLFVSRAWVDLLSKVTGVRATLDVNGALHSHPTGSKDGFIHKDFSSCWFVDKPRQDGINVADNGICNYRTGETSIAGTVARERVRAVAMIYYINNAPWTPGDGGETGLYRTDHDPIRQPAVAIPPINNTMLIFECSPHSRHGFISNLRNPRSNIVMWLHRTKPDTVAKWGEDSIVYVKG